MGISNDSLILESIGQLASLQEAARILSIQATKAHDAMTDNPNGDDLNLDELAGAIDKIDFLLLSD